METKKENRQFKWLSGNGGNGPVFPIDYSQRSFAKYLGTDPRLVKRYVINHPFFHEILQSQFCKNSSHGRFPNRSDNAVTSIPAESAVFFKCFYELAVSKKYHAALCSGKDIVSEQILPQFLHDLCQKIFLDIENDNEKENPYYRHVLFENEVFRKELLSDLWTQELEPRLEQLRELSKTARTENQLESLMDCILCLDRNIINLQIASQNNETDTENIKAKNRKVSNAVTSPSKYAIQNLLENLIQRNRSEPQNPTSPFDTYIVDDIDLGDVDHFDHIHTLWDAFRDLSHFKTKSQNELEDFVRKRYLEQLGKNKPKSDFENKYMLAMKYLRVGANVSDSLLSALVEERVKLYCRSALDQCFITPSSTIPPIREEFTELHYIAQLVDHLVDNSISPVYYRYSDTINLISCLFQADYVSDHDQHRMHYIIKNGINQILPYDALAAMRPEVSPEENLTLQETKQFAKLFSSAWQNLYGETVLDPENKHFLDLKRVAYKIYEDGSISAAYFNCIEHFPFTQRHIYDMLLTYQKVTHRFKSRNIGASYFNCTGHFPFTPEHICDMLLTYEEIISFPNQYYPYAELLRFAPNLLYFLLLIVYKRQADSTIPIIISCVKLLLKSKS